MFTIWTLNRRRDGSILLAGRWAGAHSGVDPSQKSNLEDVFELLETSGVPKAETASLKAFLSAMFVY